MLKEIELFINGKKIELSEETVRNIKKQLGISGDSRKPKKGECYWNIEREGNVCRSFHTDRLDDHERFAIGNYYKTEEEAERKVAELKAIEEVLEWKWRHQGDWEPDWKKKGEERKYYVKYFNDHDFCENFKVDFWNSNNSNPVIGYFKSKEIAEKCINECEHLLKIIWGID